MELDQKHRVEEVEGWAASRVPKRTVDFVTLFGKRQGGDDAKLEDDIEDDRGKGGRMGRHFARGLNVRAGGLFLRGLVGFVAACLARGLGLLRAVLAGIVLVLADEDAAAVHPPHGLHRGDGERQGECRGLHDVYVTI